MKLIVYETDEERYNHLDIATMLVTPPEMDREVASARWHGALDRMYKVNGALEF